MAELLIRLFSAVSWVVTPAESPPQPPVPDGMLCLPDVCLRHTAAHCDASGLAALASTCTVLRELCIGAQHASLHRDLVRLRYELPRGLARHSNREWRELLRELSAASGSSLLLNARIASLHSDGSDVVLNQSHCYTLLKSMAAGERPPDRRLVPVLADSASHANALRRQSELLEAAHPRRRGGTESEMARASQSRCGCGLTPCYWLSREQTGHQLEFRRTRNDGGEGAWLITAIELTPYTSFLTEGEPCFAPSSVVVEFEWLTGDGQGTELVYFRSAELSVAPRFESQRLTLSERPPLFCGGVLRLRFRGRGEGGTGTVAVAHLAFRGIPLPKLAAVPCSSGKLWRLRSRKHCAKCRVLCGPGARKPALRCRCKRVVYCCEAHRRRHWREVHSKECAVVSCAVVS